MKIVVLAGGTSTERDVSLSSGSKIYYALKARGHQAILLDVYLGLELNEPVTKGLFEKDIDWAKDIRAVSESHPDLSRLKEQRKDGGRSMFGPNVLALCEMADIVFLGLHGANGEDGRIQAALDLRDLLARAAEENEDLRRLAKRAEVYAAFAKDDLRRFREKTELEALEFRQKVGEELEERRQARAERVEASLRRRFHAKLEILSTISGALETCRDHLADLPDMTPEALEERRADLEEAIRRVRAREAALQNRSAAPYHRSLRLLRAHPSATAKDFAEALETLKKLGKD